ncbi:MAG: YggT family protein [Gemmatimonadaceae bacterium]
MSMLAGYSVFVAVVRTVLLYSAVVAAGICAFDWAVRTRRINPFNRSARFFRGRIEPLMAPVERVVVRAGGVPTAAPVWALLAVIVGGILLISVLGIVNDVLSQVVFGLAEPSRLPLLGVSWAFAIVKFALLARVLSSWLPISPTSKWIRWSYLLTNWMITPLRRVIPLVGMFDITPIIAWFLLGIIQGLLHIP